MSELNAPFSGGPTLNDGVTMPWLGLGVYQTKDGEEVIHAVKTAVELGYRSIDTAAGYNNEEGVGQAIRECGGPVMNCLLRRKCATLIKAMNQR